jgi:hypothetical protein
VHKKQQHKTELVGWFASLNYMLHNNAAQLLATPSTQSTHCALRGGGGRFPARVLLAALQPAADAAATACALQVMPGSWCKERTSPTKSASCFGRT